jgi:uncharacterized membrane protein YgdD (TMEM256/DUF423 family)
MSSGATGGQESRTLFVAGAFSAGTAVMIGAFGAHALRSTIPADMLAVFETGVRYQMYHAIALLATSWSATQWGRSQPRSVAASGWCFGLGTVLFSGSLYVLSITGAGWMGAVTPIGGVLFIAGWITLAYSAYKGAGPKNAR